MRNIANRPYNAIRRVPDKRITIKNGVLLIEYKDGRDFFSLLSNPKAQEIIKSIPLLHVRKLQSSTTT